MFGFAMSTFAYVKGYVIFPSKIKFQDIYPDDCIVAFENFRNPR